jgi:hypothetical protein
MTFFSSRVIGPAAALARAAALAEAVAMSCLRIVGNPSVRSPSDASLTVGFQLD